MAAFFSQAATKRRHGSIFAKNTMGRKVVTCMLKRHAPKQYTCSYENLTPQERAEFETSYSEWLAETYVPPTDEDINRMAAEDAAKMVNQNRIAVYRCPIIIPSCT